LRGVAHAKPIVKAFQRGWAERTIAIQRRNGGHADQGGVVEHLLGKLNSRSASMTALPGAQSMTVTQTACLKPTTPSSTPLV